MTRGEFIHAPFDELERAHAEYVLSSDGDGMLRFDVGGRVAIAMFGAMGYIDYHTRIYTVRVNGHPQAFMAYIDPGKSLRVYGAVVSVPAGSVLLCNEIETLLAGAFMPNGNPRLFR